MKARSLIVVVAASLAGSIAVADVAVAQKKMTYAQAFSQCKKEMSAANVPSDTLNSAARTSAGGACMSKYGYRLKKKSKF